jgi:hypothetical protein
MPGGSRNRSSKVRWVPGGLLGLTLAAAASTSPGGQGQRARGHREKLAGLEELINRRGISAVKSCDWQQVKGG